MKRQALRAILASALAMALAAAALAQAEVIQRGHLRIKVDGELSPRKLPRSGAAPISVEVGGHIESTDGSPPPQLTRMAIELNRQGTINSKGLPLCPYEALEPASTTRAMAACKQALVGTGSFEAQISLAGQESYVANGKLLAFNGRQGGRPVLFAHIYSPRPFATSFVIVFAIDERAKGTFGTTFAARLPSTLGTWGKLTGIELKLSRHYTYRGKSYSYLSAGCPAPKGFPGASFGFARASFGFAVGKTLSSTLTRSCKATG